MTEVPIIKEPIYWSAKQIIGKIYTEPNDLLFSKVGSLELFWTKKILVSTLNIMRGILCGDIISERSKL